MSVVGRSAILVAVVGVLVVSPVDAQDIHPQELARFQVTWVKVSGTLHDKSLDAETVKNNRIIFTDTRITVQSPHQTNEAIVAILTKLDPRKAPAHMDWVRSSGPHKQSTMQ